MDTDEKWCWHSVVRQIKRFRIYLRNSKSVFIRVYPWFSCIVANHSTSDQFLKVFRIARALQRDLVGGGVDFTEVVWCEFDGNCSEVFEQARQLRCARNGNNPWLLRQQPGERDLSRGRLHPRSEGVEQIHPGLS